MKPSDFILFQIAGMQHQTTSLKKLSQLLFKLELRTKLKIKHEPKNKFDENALAIYFDRKKIGYIPRDTNKLILKNIAKGYKYEFYVSSYDYTGEVEYFYFGPTVAAINVRPGRR